MNLEKSLELRRLVPCYDWNVHDSEAINPITREPLYNLCIEGVRSVYLISQPWAEIVKFARDFDQKQP